MLNWALLLKFTLCSTSPQVFFTPIFYGTGILFTAAAIAVVLFIYQMTRERDPLIYSKFITAKKIK